MLMRNRRRGLGAWFLSLVCLGVALWPALLTVAAPQPLPAAAGREAPAPNRSASYLEVVVNEIAWMGTASSATAEWVELYNNTNAAIDLTNWTLRALDGTPSITLTGSIPAHGYYLLERPSDATVPEVRADQIYTGALSNEGELLELRDATYTLIDAIDSSLGWFAGHADARVPMVRVDAAASGNQASNWTHNPRCGSPTNSAGISHTCTLTTTSVGTDLEYAVYFNPHATTAVTTTLTPTPMETALLNHLAAATSTIDLALYGLNRQSLINALIAAHQRGVTVRVVGDDDAALHEYAAGYQALLSAGIPVITDTSSYIQHNKFILIDAQVVWTGSTNFTDTGFTFNANNALVITSTTLADVYALEFEELWSGAFQNGKTDNTPHLLDYNGTLVQSYFSPTDLVAFEVWDELAHTADTLHFAMFFWTDDLLAQRTVERLADGVEVYGVWDQLGAGNVASDDETLCAAGAHNAIESFPGKLHHKFAVLDVFGADPRVILGSYNWTDSGAYNNDENTLIIHDRALAAAYYQEWVTLWQAIPTYRVCNPVSVTQVTLSGPVTGTVGQSATFTATLNATANLPVTYTWAATGQAPVVHPGGSWTATQTWGWDTPGTHLITVTASNAWGQAVATQTLTVTLPPPPPLLTVTLTGPVTGTLNTAYTFWATLNPTATLPVTYTWLTPGHSPVVQAGGGLTATHTWTWESLGVQPLTVTVQNATEFAVATWDFTVVAAPVTVTLTGPVTGSVSVAHLFQATVNPTATQPLTYTWTATAQPPIVHPGGRLTDTVSYTWDAPGPQTLTVTVQNRVGQVAATRVFTVVTLPPALLNVTLTGPVTGTVDTAATFLATVNPTATLPVTYTWTATGQPPRVQPNQGLTATMTFTWSVTGSQSITVTATNSGGTVQATRHIVLEAAADPYHYLYLPLVLNQWPPPLVARARPLHHPRAPSYARPAASQYRQILIR